MEMIDHYGALRHVGGYKKGRASCTRDKSEYKRYLDTIVSDGKIWALCFCFYFFADIKD